MHVVKFFPQTRKQSAELELNGSKTEANRDQQQ